jgi:hypothetical protein
VAVILSADAGAGSSQGWNTSPFSGSLTAARPERERVAEDEERLAARQGEVGAAGVRAAEGGGVAGRVATAHRVEDGAEIARRAVVVRVDVGAAGRAGEAVG